MLKGLKRLFRNPIKKNRIFKKQIHIKQVKENIDISGKLEGKNIRVTQLLLISRETEKTYVIPSADLNDEGFFTFNIDISKFVKSMKEKEEIVDFYLTVELPEQEYLNNKNIIKDISYLERSYKTNYIKGTMRLGRFQETLHNKIEPYFYEQPSYLYSTVKGFLSLAVNKDHSFHTRMQIDRLITKDNEIDFRGKIFTKDYKIEHIKLVLISRTFNYRYETPLQIKDMKQEAARKYGDNRYKYNCNIDINKLVKNVSFDNDVYDLFFEIKYYYCDQKEMKRIGNPRVAARLHTKTGAGVRNDTAFVTSPYYTIKRFNLSLQIEKFDKENYNYLKKMMRWSWLLRLYYNKKNIWIVGERPYKAQDTGYHFFKYMRENKKANNVYYVIEKDSPELENIEYMGNILYYKSKEHIKNTLIAKRVIGSHHPDYLFPIRTKDFIRKVKAKKVFIQHGILGTKNLTNFYGVNSPSFSTDLFMVSSDYERDIVVNDLGYKPEQVKVTGLSRFDTLLVDDVPVKRQLLIIPTWREWLVQKDAFLESEYFERYSELIRNEELHELSKKRNFELVLCLHPNMQQYSELFEVDNVKIVTQGEIDVQHLLKESAMMITDYSSVAFDFSFLNKPILYYQFDRKRFIGRKGSHIDLDNDLPGDIVYSLDEIVTKVDYYEQLNFVMHSENMKKAARFLKYNDTKSSERIYEAVNAKIDAPTLKDEVLKSEIYKALFNRFRRSKRYYPTMKILYNIMRIILPQNDKLILFESGIGKQYADSPKVIYEEIIKRNLDYKKVWVCNRNIRFSDPNTKVIRRLSPSYYYYLAKSKYWVNNQNFPTYIKKPSNTIFLQTWHGTPLKRMLHDIEEIQGRTDDYLERVSSAINNWDYLISPSEYASKNFRSAFDYKGEIIEVGYPRNDVFYNEKSQLIKETRKKLKLPANKKVILYAPTFRDNETAGTNKFIHELKLDLEKMQDSLGDEYVVLLRMHVLIRNRLKIDEALENLVYDVSNYMDMQDLLLISDILITDYSSVMFDYANTKRPMLFFVYDFEQYRDETRGFYMDFENEAPGPFVFNTEEIIENIKNMSQVQNVYKDKYENFYKKYCSLENGKATKKIVDQIFES